MRVKPRAFHVGHKILAARQFISRPRYTTLFHYFRRLKSARILKSKPVRNLKEGPWSVRYLTCKAQLLETIWSAKSLYQYVDAPLFFHEDGSFDSECHRTLSKHFPDATVISRSDSDDLTIPALSNHARTLREKLVFFLRVFDFQLWAREPYLQVDSDVLFFSSPDQLLRATNGDKVRYNCGCLSDYSSMGWKRQHILERTGIALTGGFNAGLLFMPFRIDFARVEGWLDSLGEPTSLWSAEQTILNLESITAGMEALSPEYDIFERNWPNVISEHYVERTRLNMYRRGYRILEPVLC